MEELLEMLPRKVREWTKNVLQEGIQISEIRLRAGQPVVFAEGAEQYYIREEGRVSREREGVICVDVGLVRNTLEELCHYSLYAYQEELKKGYFTLKGGHRVGVAGTVIYGEKSEIVGMKYISYLNIRIAVERRAVSEKALPYIYNQGDVYNTLIISPPGYGKTSWLRDLIYQISEGNAYGKGKNVSVVDERGEISGNAGGGTGINLGCRTDILYGCEKEKGMLLLLRAMSPEVIAVDELGGTGEKKALEEMSRSGVKVIATIHGRNMEELLEKSQGELPLFHTFECLIFLNRVGKRYGMKEILLYEKTKGKYERCREFWEEF